MERCQHIDENREQCRLYNKHRAKHLCIGPLLELTIGLTMEEEAHLAYEHGIKVALDMVEQPCVSRDVGAPGSLMRRANDLGRRLAVAEQQPDDYYRGDTCPTHVRR